MKLNRFAVVLFLAASFVVSVTPAQAATEWNPKRTWVFFVGLVKWKDSESFESFPAENRKDGLLIPCEDLTLSLDWGRVSDWTWAGLDRKSTRLNSSHSS